MYRAFLVHNSQTRQMTFLEEVKQVCFDFLLFLNNRWWNCMAHILPWHWTIYDDNANGLRSARTGMWRLCETVDTALLRMRGGEDTCYITGSLLPPSLLSSSLSLSLMSVSNHSAEVGRAVLTEMPELVTALFNPRLVCFKRPHEELLPLFFQPSLGRRKSTYIQYQQIVGLPEWLVNLKEACKGWFRVTWSFCARQSEWNRIEGS